MKNFMYWMLASLTGGVLFIISFVLVVAILRVAWDALTCPHNIFERDIHARWQSEGK